MNAFLSKGGIAGLLGFGAALAAAFGKNNLSTVFADPTTAQTVTVLAAGVASIVAGLLPNKKAAAPAAPSAPAAS